jgi:uncharacterized protein YerC
VRDVVASYGKLICLFERVHLFLERLSCYTGISLTTSMTVLLGKIMAQVLSILAISAKAMNEGRISETIPLTYIFLADDELERFLKGLMRRTDIEEALLRLDMLTREETLMAAARTLEVTHHIHENVTTVKELAQDVHNSTKVIEEVTRGIDHGAKSPLTFIHQPTVCFPSHTENKE